MSVDSTNCNYVYMVYLLLEGATMILGICRHWNPQKMANLLFCHHAHPIASPNHALPVHNM